MVDRSKLGKRSKVKGSNYERLIAKKFKEKYGLELVRTPQSGGFAKKISSKDFKGDVVLLDDTKDFKLHIEAKCQKTLSVPKWLSQAEEDCVEGKIPLVVFHKHNSSQDYVVLSLEDFFFLVDEEKIVSEVK